jgi:hypothetical protein
MTRMIRSGQNLAGVLMAWAFGKSPVMRSSAKR